MFSVCCDYARTVPSASRKAVERFIFSKGAASVSIPFQEDILPNVTVEQINLSEDKNGRKQVVVIFVSGGIRNQFVLVINRLATTKDTVDETANELAKCKHFCKEPIPEDVESEMAVRLAHLIAHTALSWSKLHKQKSLPQVKHHCFTWGYF